MFDHLPKNFTKTIAGAFREDGKRWLESLPEIVAELEENWSLKVEKPFPNLSYHFVAPCVCSDGSEAVLKIGFPGEKQYILNEFRILKYLNGENTVKLLRFDDVRFAFLLERLTPGENLKTIYRNDDAKTVETAIEVMRGFWQKPPNHVSFPKLEDWFQGLVTAEKVNFPPRYAGKALSFFDELTKSGREMLLHGDFHHENILSASRQPFLAIDPKGITGAIGYDIGIFLINHANWLKSAPNQTEKLDKTIRQFSKAFEIAPQDLRKWVFAHSVLSAWWTFEENGANWEAELVFADFWEV